MKAFVLGFVFPLLTFMEPMSATAQPTLLAIEDGEFSFFEPIINESGEAFALLGFSLVHQDGSNSAPNPILTVDGQIGDDTLRLIHTDLLGPRPLAPVFGSDDVLLNARIERPDTTQVNSLIIVSPNGQAVDQIDGDNAALFNQGVTPTDKEFGMQAARSYLGDAIPNNQIETVIGFATAIVDAQTNGPTTSFLATFRAASMNVLSASLGFTHTRIETHGTMKDSISINDLIKPIGPPIPNSAPVFRYGYSNVNGPGSFVLRPPGTDANTLTYATSTFLVDAGAETPTRLLDVEEFLETHSEAELDQLFRELSDSLRPLASFDPGNPLDFVFERFEVDFDVIDEIKGFGWGSSVVGKINIAVPPSTVRVVVITPGSISTAPGAAPEGCDCDEIFEQFFPEKTVDLNDNGVVDSEDVDIAIACAWDINQTNCRDVNHDGVVDWNDVDCVSYCVKLAESAGETAPGRGPQRGLDPTLVQRRIGVIMLMEGEPVPDRPQLTVGAPPPDSPFGLTRAHPNGFGLYGVRAFPGEDPADNRILLISKALRGPPSTVFEEGVDYGDGVVATIPGNGVSNINRAGQFAVVAILESGETAIYRVQIEAGGAPPPNTARRDWRLYI